MNTQNSWSYKKFERRLFVVIIYTIILYTVLGCETPKSHSKSRSLIPPPPKVHNKNIDIPHRTP